MKSKSWKNTNSWLKPPLLWRSKVIMSVTGFFRNRGYETRWMILNKVACDVCVISSDAIMSGILVMEDLKCQSGRGGEQLSGIGDSHLEILRDAFVFFFEDYGRRRNFTCGWWECKVTWCFRLISEGVSK